MSQLKPREIDALRRACKEHLYILANVIGFNDMNVTLHKDMCNEAQDMTMHRVIHLEPRGHFKCQSVGTKILPYSIDLHSYKMTNTTIQDGEEFNCDTPYRVIFKTGKEIICTQDHPLLTFNGWIKSENLVCGDKVATARCLPNDRHALLSNKLNYLLGVLLGDGCLTRSTPHVSLGDKEMVEILESDGWTLKYRGKYDYAILGITQEIRKLGLEGKLSYDKFIPKECKYSSDLIAGLYDTDGSINLHASCIMYGSTSEKLIDDLQSELLCYGIVARKIHLKTNSKFGKYWHLNIYGQEFIKNFHKNIPLRLTRKINQLKQLVKTQESFSNHNTNFDTVPREWRRLLNYGDTKKLRLEGIRIDTHKYHTSRSKLLEVSDFLKRDDLKQIATSDIYWDEVKEIIPLNEPVKMKAIGSIPYHNYISANGIINHNTSIYSITRPIWRYINDNNVRILLAASSATNASKRVRRIQRVFESNQLFRSLFPESIPADFRKTKWTEFEALLPRKNDFLESTFEAIGVGGKVTGRHYTELIKDDLIDESCLESETGLLSEIKLRETVQWDEYSESLFDEPVAGYDIIVGTRWGLYDYYAAKMKDPLYKCFVRAAVNKDGTLIFPERFTKEWFDQKLVKEPYVFNLQYMNNPIAPGMVEIDASWIRYYELDLQENIAVTVDGKREIISPQSLDRILLIDPGLSSKKKADDTGVAAVGIDRNDRIFILEAWNGKYEPEAMLEKVFELKKKWNTRAEGIESVAAQRVFLGFADYMARQSGKRINVVELKPDRNLTKLARIRGIIPFFKSGQIYLQRGMIELINQIIHFPQGGLHLLDALAYGPQLWRAGYAEDHEVEQEIKNRDEEILQSINLITGY